MRLLYACGYPLAQIGSEFGCSAETVRNYTAGRTNTEDNVTSDDEYLDENLLLRLRKEKRITIVSTPRILKRSGVFLISLTIIITGCRARTTELSQRTSRMGV